MILEILKYPNPILRKPAETVTEFTEANVKLATDMLETMYAAGGIGLAAPQVGESKRIIVVDISQTQDQPVVLINPMIVEMSVEDQTYSEGCLSFPGVFEKVKSPQRIKVKYQTYAGEETYLEADGLLAVCVSHEIDHLAGKLIVDRVDSKKRIKIKTRMMGGK